MRKTLSEMLLLCCWKKGDSCHTVAESLATVLEAVTWKVKSIRHQLDDLPMGISRQNTEGTIEILLAACSKRGERQAQRTVHDPQIGVFEK